MCRIPLHIEVQMFIQKKCAVLFVNTNKIAYIVKLGNCFLNTQFRTLGKAVIDSSDVCNNVITHLTRQLDVIC